MASKNTEYQNHLLACLGEECGELQQAVGKSLRFGLYRNHPSNGSVNLEDIQNEFRDVLAVFQMLMDELAERKLFESSEIEYKKKRVMKYYDANNQTD